MLAARRIVLPLLLLFADPAAGSTPEAPARIAMVFNGKESHAPEEFERALDGLGDVLAVQYFSPNRGGEPLEADTRLDAFDLVFVDAAYDGLALTEEQLAGLRSEAVPLVVVNGGDDGPQATVDQAAHPDVPIYWANRSLANDRSLALYLVRDVLGRSTVEAPREPVVYPSHGFYHPDAPRLFADSEAFRSWYAAYRREAGLPEEGDGRIGLVGHRVWVQKEQTRALDAVIREVEARGAYAVPLVIKGAAELADHLAPGGEPIVDVVLWSGEMLDYQDPEAGRDHLRRLGVPVLLALNHYRLDRAGYRESTGGLAPTLTPRLVYSERDAMIEPLVVGTDDPDGGFEPWPDQVRWRVDRALGWARLRRVPNEQKRIVVSYWSEAGGRSDVGGDPDDFLDVQGSAVELLRVLRDAGFDVGDGPLPDPERLGRRMAEEASNVGGWADGMLAERAAEGVLELVPERTYLTWYERLPEARRQEIEAVWGPPPGDVMVTRDGTGGRAIAIPRLRYGNVLLAPHPMWGYYEDEQVLLSDGELPPHHQYVAYFLWMQNQVQAHAWVSLFSNLVLQPGKAQGPIADEHVGVLLGGIPHLHPERLGANGGLGTKRKVLAQTTGWYNVVVPTDQLGESAELAGVLRRFRSQADPELRGEIGSALREILAEKGLLQAIAPDAEEMNDEALADALAAWLEQLAEATAPWGGRVLGTVPEDDARVAMIGGMLGPPFARALREVSEGPAEDGPELLRAVVTRDLSPGAAAATVVGRRSKDLLDQLSLAADFDDRLREAPRELSALLDALQGRWIEPGLAGEAYREPDVLPPGRSLFGFDPARMPTPEAERIGVRQAEALIEAHREANDGAYPDELAFVLWSGEIAKNHGVTEAQALHLLGTRPVRNWRGEVVDVELIPRETLGRPRVDVLLTTSGVYRDQYQDKVQLIARAVELAAASPEPDNPVRRATEETTQALVRQGEDPDKAQQLGRARVFSPAPGAYSPSIQFLAKSGDQRGGEARMADLYTRRMSHAYGGGLFGAPAREAFSDRLTAMDAATLPRSSDVNGLLDHPMSAAFLGGLNLARRAITGEDTDLYVTNLRDLERPRLEQARDALRRELESRYFNPAWLRENQSHGYDGARNFMFLTDHLDLWDSTADRMVTSGDWQEVKQVFVDDRYGLAMDAFFDRYNPYAHQMLLTNLLGAAQRGHWEASREDLQQVARRLTESVAEHGPACEANQCRNSAMTQYVGEILEALPEAAPSLDAYVQQIAGASAEPAAAGAPGAAPDVTGQRMEQQLRPRTEPFTAPALMRLLILVVAVSLIGIGWYRRGVTSLAS